MIIGLIWLAVRIAIVTAIVVVPFGYAITGLHTDVLMGAGCGVAIGVGVGIRGGSQSGLWTGVLVGVITGICTALIAGLIPQNPLGLLVPPVLALTVGLIDGLREDSLSGYRDVSRESFIVSLLLVAGLLPAWIVQGVLSMDSLLGGAAVVAVTVLWFAWTALIAGLLSHRRPGWRDSRPPTLLILGAALLPTLIAVGLATGNLDDIGGLTGIDLVVEIALILGLTFLVLPVAAFLLGRMVMTWMQPRLQVYGYLADYLRVMWVPIGAFAVGYLTIIGLFAGFYGMLERFQPGAFAEAGTGVTEWLSFAFYTAFGQDFSSTVPVSSSARVLVGIHLILSAGWAIVLFAAVMSSIGPKLDEIARRHADE